MENAELIIKDITQINSSYEESFIKAILQRLLCFGYKAVKEDAWCLIFSVDKIINHIKNVCNISDIPKELNEIVIDKICGEFLYNKKQSNQLDLDNFDLDMAVKQIQAGDTNIQFAIENSETDEQKLNSLINYLANYGESDLIRFRRIKW